MFLYLQLLDTQEEKHKFELLYEQNRDLMWKNAFRILHNAADAEDAVHMAFLKVVEHFDSIGELSSPQTKGFLIVVTRHKAIDIYRKNKRRATFELKDWDEDPATELQGEDDLSSCILRLPANYRDLILLKYCQGYSTKEAADLMGISVANASKMDQRAKKKLEQLYREERCISQ